VIFVFVVVHIKPTPKRTNVPSSVSHAPSTFASFASPSFEINLSGDLNEQCRDAIKANDLSAVKKLLSAGADACYIDRTGNCLLHLCAMFDKLDLCTILIEAGAKVDVKNPAGETPLDLAPPSLAIKMKQVAIQKQQK
jgi:hypothetical protein